MVDYTVREVPKGDWPPLLNEIPQPPQHLWAAGTLPSPQHTLLAVVGSRQYTSYGKQVVDHLIGGLAGAPVGIVSGLALGIDALAHEAALRHSLYTIAVPGSGLAPDVLYPATNRQLARRIVEQNGALLSEFPPPAKAAQWTFTQRNRIMAGMSQATLLIEAGERSGTLITARLAADYNREVLAVPGSIFSATSLGTHQFIKLGATPVTTAADILDVLGLKNTVAPAILPPLELSEAERAVIDLLREPRDKDSLIRHLDKPVTEVNILLMQMEIHGYISEENNVYISKIRDL